MCVRAGPALSEGQYKLDSALTEVPGGDVVIAGGQVVNVYDPDRDSIRALREPILGARSFVCATAVGRGRVLVTGGYDASITPSDQAWLVEIPTG